MSALEIKDNDGIRWLTLNRPDQMNALTVESLVEFVTSDPLSADVAVSFPSDI